MSKKPTSVHHLIPRGAGGTEDYNNKIRIRDSLHVNHHRLFNAASPIEQLIHVLTFNKKVLNDRFVLEIIKVLDKYSGNYYNIEVTTARDIGALFQLEKDFNS